MEEVPPQLLAMLKPGGRMVLPVGKPALKQELTTVDKALDGSISVRTVGQLVTYTPLTPPWADKIW